MAELQQASIAQLEKELARKRDRVEKLRARREELLDRLGEMDAEMKELVGDGSKAGTQSASSPAAGKAAPAVSKPSPKKGKKKTGRKRKRKPQMKEAIAKILADSSEPMTAASIADELKRRRFRTKSKNFVALVRETIRRSDSVQRVGRGLYTASA